MLLVFVNELDNKVLVTLRYLDKLQDTYFISIEWSIVCELPEDL